ncbi:MAG: hypothetical protein IAE94_06475 [Chthoniobacterales bacterium]|nr:hypothetical protein [Chthoniobacterales bacterium]
MMNFDDLLREHRARGAEMPAAGAFAQDVLREIRLKHTRQKSELRGWRALLEGIWHPPILASALAVAVVVGAMAPVIVLPSANSVAADMEIFTGSSRNLPSGLLASIR